jgi:hypothetical protein
LDFLKENVFAKKVDDKYNIKLSLDTVKLTVPEFVEKINTDQKFKDEVYDVIASEYVMKYRDPNSVISEDIEVDENAEED